MSTAAAKAFFKLKFGHPPAHIVSAPGRVELLGNHTDYNEGLVMAASVDKHVFLAVSPRTDGKIELHSSAFPKPEVFWISELKPNPGAPWANYVKGVLVQLRKRGAHWSGFSAAIHSTIPMGAGMSSSAALEIATALAVRQMFPFRITELGVTIPPRRDVRGKLPPLDQRERMPLARMCHAAERQFVGVNCGLLDQISSLHGKAWQVMNIDCRFNSVELLPLVGEALVICDSGVRHQLADGDYNLLRQHCEEAARKLKAKNLRSIELRHLKASRALLTEREYECAFHVVSEIQRVAFAERALREDDHYQFGQYMWLSHESSRDSLRNSCPELDTLVALAREHPACLGARLTGGGFGGATINLVRYHEVEQFMEHMATKHLERTGKPLTPMVCQIVDGAK
ncbi:MAG TPA: galactokinase family protein [Verrucomicrobiae bacterium]|nr:galactokinase family protein [Verrucomicrobiae bacterium]